MVGRRSGGGVMICVGFGVMRGPGVVSTPESPGALVCPGPFDCNPSLDSTNRLPTTMISRPMTATSGAIGVPGPLTGRRVSPLLAGFAWRPRVIPAWEALGLAPPRRALQ